MQCLTDILLLDKVFMGEFKNPFGLLDNVSRVKDWNAVQMFLVVFFV